MTERPARVLAVTPDYPPAIGGIQLLVHRVLSNASRIDKRVVTIAPPTVDRSAAGRDGVVHSPSSRDHRIEIVLMNGVAIAEARRFRPDVVLAAHIVASPAGAAISRLLRVPSVLYVYGKEVGASPGIAAFGIRTSAAVIAISRYARSLALEAGAQESTVHIVPPGVDPAEPSGEARLDRPTILTVARLEDRYKGHDVLVRALPLIRARVPDVQWVVLGEGQLREEILELARANQVSGLLVMPGGVSDAERNAWLDRAHVFAMPSRLPAGRGAGEGFGIVYLEAGLHRLPVVAGDVGGSLDAVVDGETGLLVDPTSSVAVADAIVELLLDRSRSERMGVAGYRRACRFDWPSISTRVEEILLTVAAAERGSNIPHT